MKKKKLEVLRPYAFLGIDLEVDGNGGEAVGECPFCSEEKFSVNTETGQWQCWKCAMKGNTTTFLAQFHKHLHKGHSFDRYVTLRRDRGLFGSQCLKSWKIVWNSLTRHWLVPGYEPSGKLKTLYRYSRLKGRMCLLPCPTLGHALHGVNLFNKELDTVCLCEGIWDGVRVWETVGAVKPRQMNVLASPGCNVFLPEWCGLFEKKKVLICFDNDHPKTIEKTGKVIPPTGYTLAAKHAKALLESRTPPASVEILTWGDSEKGYSESLPSGYDLRDYLNPLEL